MPFGRFQVAPWHIECSGAVQKCMGKLLEGLEGVVCHMDDVLMVGKDQEQDDASLTKVFE